ncbi:MAG: AbrB/MazE/SpoVT family DNA-binding domain-containing protein [Bacillota bacterium]|nr:AbrB/MazE/SpoVT family DNA-binding domain-containing protein [Bacillota bacterium]
MKKKNEPQPYMGTVKVGPKGQIVIPKEIRDMFDIEPGNSLMILAHPKKGIALERPSVMTKIATAILSGKGKEIYPEEETENLEIFAENIKKTTEGQDNNDKNSN